MVEEAPKIEVRGISKSFPGVQALDNVSFRVRRGEVHVLCGENGAGKSTLMKIIDGVHRPDSGKIILDGREVHIRDPHHARELGISMIFQELNYIPQMTVAEFLFLGRLPVRKWGQVDWKAVYAHAAALLESEQLDYSPSHKMQQLSVSSLQMLEIVKAVSLQADLIIMDEPTSAITLREADALFAKIHRLRAAGVSIIYISHKMDEFFKIADTITVLRGGKVVATLPSEQADIDQIICMMVGRSIEEAFPHHQCSAGDTILEVRHLNRKGYFRGINFSVRAGEIVGFAGMIGAGRSELMRAIFGVDPYDSGEILLHGKSANISSVRQSIARHIVMLTEDRRRYGFIPMRSVSENITLASLKQFFSSGRWLKQKENTEVERLCQRLSLKTPSIRSPVHQLSGGNQQKVVLAKWLLTQPEIFIMDEPTRGVDVGAKYEIYCIMVELAQQGKGIILVSSELPELLGLCDRIYVMSEGEIRGELEQKAFDEGRIMRMATSVGGDEA